jgi:hypothetical protein
MTLIDHRLCYHSSCSPALAGLEVVSGGLEVLEGLWGRKLPKDNAALLHDAVLALDAGLGQTQASLHTWYTDLTTGATTPFMPPQPWPDALLSSTAMNPHNFGDPGEAGSAFSAYF